MLAQVDLEGPISEAWERVVVFVPKLLGFLAILIIGYFVAKLLERVVDRLLERVGFDRWVERGALREALARSRFDASDIMATIVFWTAMLFVLQLAFGVFGSNPISELIAGVIAFLPKLFVAVLILVIAAALARVITELLEAVLGTVSGGGWIARGAGIAVLVLGIFMALNQLEIAPEIVNGLFYAILAIVVGSAIVAIGGGGIQTMRTYWERAAARTEVKARELKQQARPEAARERMEQATERASAETPAPGTGSRWAG